MQQSKKDEYASTYFVQDRSNLQEMERLELQDRMITTAMGGVLSDLPAQADPAHFQRVLDVGCGTGGWLIETAKHYPTISSLIGVDISKKMLEHAQGKVIVEDQAPRRVEFLLMDALRMLEFPNNFFDFINMRFALSFVRTWEWAKLLQEIRRVAKHGATLRVTDTTFDGSGSSPTMLQLQALIFQTSTQAGYAFPEGMTVKLPQLLEQHGFEKVSTHLYTPEYRAGTIEGELYIEDTIRVFRTVLPFLRKWIVVPDNYEELYQQMIVELHQPDFYSTWPIVSVCGFRV